MSILLFGLVLAHASFAYWSRRSNVNKNVIFNTADNLKEYKVSIEKSKRTISKKYNLKNIKYMKQKMM